jgi:hypothetical protein
MVTAARLRELLDYDPATGRFTWRKWRGGRGTTGSIAGALQPHGYHRIRIDGKYYYRSRLAVLWMTGKLPNQQVDHANGNSDDDRWSNLRQSTQSQNMGNSRPRKRKLPKGVSWIRNRGLYRAQLQVNYRRIKIGCFDTIEEAHAAYCAAARKHFGRFARFA